MKKVRLGFVVTVVGFMFLTQGCVSNIISMNDKNIEKKYGTKDYNQISKEQRIVGNEINIERGSNEVMLGYLLILKELPSTVNSIVKDVKEVRDEF